MRLCSLMHTCFVFFSCRTSPIKLDLLHKKDEDKSENDKDDEPINDVQQYKPFNHVMNR
jgi:hypothetical protein